MRSRDGWFEYSRNGTAIQRRPGAIGQVQNRLCRHLGFRSADLNIVGWTAALAPGLLAGIIIAVVTNGPLLPLAPLGLALSWTVALIIDRIAWRRMCFGITLTDVTSRQAREILGALEAQGIPIELDEGSEPGTNTPEWTLRSINRHLGQVEAAIRYQRKQL